MSNNFLTDHQINSESGTIKLETGGEQLPKLSHDNKSPNDEIMNVQKKVIFYCLDHFNNLKFSCLSYNTSYAGAPSRAAVMYTIRYNGVQIFKKIFF